MREPWPPPPDLASLRELVATADIEGFIAEGSPLDEYDTEAELLHARIGQLPSAALTVSALTPVLDSIWTESFSLTTADLATRRDRLESLAQQIARFFGPEAEPSVRQTPA